MRNRVIVRAICMFYVCLHFSRADKNFSSNICWHQLEKYSYGLELDPRVELER